jgi:hypothetical protein
LNDDVVSPLPLVAQGQEPGSAGRDAIQEGRLMGEKATPQKLTSIATNPESCFSDEAIKLFKDWKRDELRERLEGHHKQLIELRVDSIQYGDPTKLTPKKHAILNSQVLRQALLHRAERLLVASGPMLVAKNVYVLHW